MNIYRIAPTPSGYLHLGNLFNAVLVTRLARAEGAEIILRIDDLDADRAKPEYLEHLLEGRRLLEQHPEPRWWSATWDEALTQLLLAAYLPMEDGRLEEHGKAALERVGVVESLHQRAAQLLEHRGLLGGLDPLGHGVDQEIAGHRHQRGEKPLA